MPESNPEDPFRNRTLEEFEAEWEAELQDIAPTVHVESDSFTGDVLSIYVLPAVDVFQASAVQGAMHSASVARLFELAVINPNSLENMRGCSLGELNYILTLWTEGSDRIYGESLLQAEAEAEAEKKESLDSKYNENLFTYIKHPKTAEGEGEGEGVR